MELVAIYMAIPPTTNDTAKPGQGVIRIACNCLFDRSIAINPASIKSAVSGQTTKVFRMGFGGMVLFGFNQRLRACLPAWPADRPQAGGTRMCRQNR